MDNPAFKVCVTCFTFNQSKYITDTLNGFVVQQTNFPFVCCIVDDASIDGEQDIIRRYIKDNFDLSDNSYYLERETDYASITYARHKTNMNCFFAVLYLKENLYSKNASYRKIQYISEWRDRCEYEALCEGDDYWTVADKLQTQVTYLDSHPEFGMCYTRVKVLNQEEGTFEEDFGGPCTTFEQFLEKNTVPTLTVLYRTRLRDAYFKEIHPENKGWLMGDYPTWLWFSHDGKIAFIDTITGVYRRLKKSASHDTDKYKAYAFFESSLDVISYFADYYGVKINVIPRRNKLLRTYLRQDLNCSDPAFIRFVLDRLSPVSFEDRFLLFVFKHKTCMALYSLYRKIVHRASVEDS